MVSLKAIFRCLSYMSLFVLFLLAGSFLFAARDLTIGGFTCLDDSQKACCVNGKMICVDKNDPTYNICLISCSGGIGGGFTLNCYKGDVEYKPSGECGTSKRTCCSGASWSDWDKDCPEDACGSNECWNGSICEKKGELSRSCFGNVSNALSGTQTRTATCNTGSGWRYSDWSGACTCKTGYTWSSNSCVPSTPGSTCNCTTGERLITYADGSCCCEFKNCGQTTSSGLVSMCKCTADSTVGYRWVEMGPTCHSKYSCINAQLPTCNERNAGRHYEIWVDEYNDGVNGANSCNGERRGYCKEMLCTQ